MTKKRNNIFNSRLKTVSLALALVFVLTCASFSWLAIPTSAEGLTSAPRDYGDNGYILYFYPEVGDNGTVTPKGYWNLCGRNSEHYGFTKGSKNVKSICWDDRFANTTFGTTTDGFLTLKPDATGKNFFGIEIELGSGIMPNERAKYVTVCYRVIGETFTAEQNEAIQMDAGAWGGEDIAILPFQNADDNWVISTSAERTIGSNWWYDNQNVTILFPGLTNADAYVVIDYIAFCETEADVKSFSTASEQYHIPFRVSRENRTYGNAAVVGLYFDPAVGEDGTASMKVRRIVSPNLEPDYDKKDVVLSYTKFVSDLTFGTSDDGFLTLGNTANTVNKFTMSFTGWTGVLTPTEARYMIVRYRVDGETQPSGKILFGDQHTKDGWGGNRADISITGTPDSNGWITICKEITSYKENYDQLVAVTPTVQFPDLQNASSCYVLDYIGFCADETACDATLAAIEQANSYDLFGGVQLSQTSNRTVRFVGKLDALNEKYDKVGFVLTANGMSYTMTADKAYTSILADGEPLTAESEGCKYFYTFAVENIPTDQGTIRFTVTPYVYLNGKTDVIMGATVSFGYNPTTNELVKLA